MLGDPEQDTVENGPTSIVAPWNYSIDPSTIQWNPGQYMNMAKEALFGPSNPQAQQPSIPEMPAAPQGQTVPPMVQPHPHEDIIKAASTHIISPESKPLLTAIDTGVADKKYLKPVDMIREGVKTGDAKMVEKGRKGIADMVLGDRSPMEWYSDTFAYGGRNASRANQIAGDVVMREIAEATGLGMPGVEEAMQTGLIRPNELLPGSQVNPIYAPPLRDPTGMSAIPGARLRPLQNELIDSRLKAMLKPGHGDPAGLQEFNKDFQTQIQAFVEQNKRYPTATEQVPMIAQARNRVPGEPIKGGLNEKKLIAGTKLEEAQAGHTEAQTSTENQMRPFRIQTAQASTTESLARAQESMAKASTAVTNGDIAVQRAELAKAGVDMSNIKSQIIAAMGALAMGDVSQEDRVKTQNFILEMQGSLLRISHKAGLLGHVFDFGKPNITPEFTGEPKPGMPATPQATPVPAPFSPVNPFDFAPRSPQGGQPQLPGIPQGVPQGIPQIQPLPPLTQPQSQAPSLQDEYNQLRKAGLTKEQATKALEKKYGK